MVVVIFTYGYNDAFLMGLCHVFYNLIYFQNILYHLWFSIDFYSTFVFSYCTIVSPKIVINQY